MNRATILIGPIAVVLYVAVACSEPDVDPAENRSSVDPDRRLNPSATTDSIGDYIGASHDPAESLYGFVQAMANNRVERACAIGSASLADGTGSLKQCIAKLEAGHLGGPSVFPPPDNYLWDALAEEPIEAYTVDGAVADLGMLLGGERGFEFVMPPFSPDDDGLWRFNDL